MILQLVFIAYSHTLQVTMQDPSAGQAHKFKMEQAEDYLHGEWTGWFQTDVSLEFQEFTLHMDS